jgi:hypothetical protein
LKTSGAVRWRFAHSTLSVLEAARLESRGNRDIIQSSAQGKSNPPHFIERKCCEEMQEEM